MTFRVQGEEELFSVYKDMARPESGEIYFMLEENPGSIEFKKEQRFNISSCKGLKHQSGKNARSDTIQLNHG